ncbi:MAG: cation-transporting P-type ATPase [Rhodocyclaceae bacterium]
MNLAGIRVDQAHARLGSSPDGLTDEEAVRRAREFGPNRVEALPRTPLWRHLAAQFVHFFALILWLAAALALAAERAQPGQGMAEMGFAILAVILVNGLFSFWQEHRAETALAALGALLPSQAKVVRGGVSALIDASALVPGDLVLLEEGDRVPADCRLTEASGLRVDLSTLTGESLPKARSAGPDPEPDPLRAHNRLLAGTTIVSGRARALVYATGSRTEFGRISRLTQTSGERISPLQREVSRLSAFIAALAVGLGVAFFLIGQAIGLPPWANVMFAIGILVANVPEGLLPTVTLSLAMATQRMARRNALVRHLPAVEALGCTSVIVSDKTGTLTCNRMSVRRTWLPRGASPAHLLEVMAACHTLRRGRREGTPQWLGDPMEVALVEHAAARGVAAAGAAAGEIPFDHERKRMSVVTAGENGRRLLCKGALESLLAVCDRIETAQGVVPLDDAGRGEALAAQEAMADEGLRILAAAWRECPEGSEPEEAGLILCGLAGIEDPPRAEVPEAIRRCREAGIRVIMVTGDHPHTALSIGREIGLFAAAVPVMVTGEELARMNAAELQLALDAPGILCARAGAQQKMRIVEALQAKGHVVAVTGDGVNDAPALRAADIGVAMGIAGTDVAKEAADMVLLDDNFATIVAAIEEGRAVYDNLRKFLTYILTSNIPEILPYLAFVLLRIPLPLTVVQILAVDLGTDLFPALALGAEPPHPEVMNRPPRPRSRRLLDAGLLARAYGFLGMMEAAAALAAFFLVLAGGQWHYGEALASSDPLYLRATSACLAAIVVCQIANVMICRDPLESLFRASRGRNHLLPAAIVIEIALLLLILYTAPGNRLFGTAAPPAQTWLACLSFAAGMVALEEARKFLVRRAQAPRTPSR